MTQLVRYTDRAAFLADLAKDADAMLPPVMPHRMGVAAMLVADTPVITIDFAGTADASLNGTTPLSVWGSIAMTQEDQVLNLIQGLTNSYMAAFKKTPS